MNDLLEWAPCYRSLWNSEGVRLLSLAARGAYWELLMLQFAEGSIPNDKKQLARLIGCDSSDIAEVWPEIEGKFVEVEPGRLANKRMAEIRLEQLAKHEAKVNGGKIGAARRWANKPTNAPNGSPNGSPIESPNNSGMGATIVLPISSPVESANVDPIAIDKSREDKKNEEHKEGNESKENLTLGGTGGKARHWEVELFNLLPESHRTDAVRLALTEYGKLRRQKGWGALAPVTVEARAKAWAEYSPEQIVSALKKSTEHGWQMVDPAKEKIASGQQAVSAHDAKGKVLAILEGKKCA